ncbi:MAG: hypothetical protein A2Z91_01005 [Deltaproteobacteria bacterium GWA2_38_16]|nr:MAG: hypothetical protein A2Z91_01005 [Deltaproteobacteria bacterium GWA2_38_16]OGQ02979.1 MAG: hypothetical protein A3D19_01025 [Deltaproteobacteria bacterium RIFCSPHIGHO2_02_FULL_38_15]OGQ34520.1 MAG: hypothetical protein A3A72_05165 [Deltaproteobacteria bacterium RIFCSPLOWO2_01_FULL_38_9]OGQ59222.1 MAG: hypothetical protein A3G92_06900 [Deltaproteobacteria bacterium RIFCSPLOWO2_12_FULL_38_8]HBQ21920.1 hypothetical protein [Deltaproteobacteria bacterium]
MKKILFFALAIGVIFSGCDKGGGGGGTGGSTSSQSITGHTGDAEHFRISEEVKYTRDVARTNIARFTVTFTQALKANGLADVMAGSAAKKSLLYLETAFLKDTVYAPLKAGGKTYQEIKQVYSWKHSSQNGKQVIGAISLWGIADKNAPDVREPIALPDQIKININSESIPLVLDDSGHAGYADANTLVRNLTSGL